MSDQAPRRGERQSHPPSRSSRCGHPGRAFSARGEQSPTPGASRREIWRARNGLQPRTPPAARHRALPRALVHPHAVFLAVGERYEKRLATVRLAIERNPVVLADVANTLADTNDDVGPAAAAAARTLVEEVRDVFVEADAGHVEERPMVEKANVHLSRFAGDSAARAARGSFGMPRPPARPLPDPAGTSPNTVDVPASDVPTSLTVPSPPQAMTRSA